MYFDVGFSDKIPLFNEGCPIFNKGRGASMVSILIVDDSAIDRQLMDGLLSKEADFDVWTAETAQDALDQMRQGMIDIVVTDLQMPEKDGLGLVRSINGGFPDIPAILVTAHGSEDIASAALNEGAAGYVPKTSISKKLTETIRNVWALMQSERSYEKLAQHTLKTEFKFELDSDAALIPPLVDLAQQTIKGIADCETVERLRITVCLEQALLNALYHGNLEVGNSFPIPAGDELPDAGLNAILQERLNNSFFSNRKIKVLVQVKTNRVSFIVRDDGGGFDVSTEETLNEGGRGLILMRHFMDEVKFNAKGNEVTMVKYLGKRRDSDTRVPQIAEDEPKPLLYGRLIALQSGRETELKNRRILVGRRKSCHVMIPHSDVSAHHCQLFVEEGWWCVKDLESSNGIKINGKRVDKGVLGPEDVVSFGRHEFQLKYVPAELGAVGINRPTLK
jgi:DNA-binding NarL/FixJ family response regulator